MTKQIKAGAGRTPRTFFDRKVRQSGHTTTIAVGKVIPKNWRYVRLNVVSQDEDTVILQVKKLLGAEDYPRNQETNKTSKQNTPKTRLISSNDVNKC